MKINDKYIITYFSQKDGQINGQKLRKEKLIKNSKVLKYLKHRYDPEPFIGYLYVIQCIFKKCKELPKCKTCGKILKSVKREHCSFRCSTIDPVVKEKSQNTRIRLYGNPHYNNVEQIKQTNLKNYGVEFPLQSKIIQNKTIKSYYKHKEKDPNFKNSIVEKRKKTKKKKYNNENYTNREKSKKTCLKNWGVENPFQSEKCKEKAKKTKKKKYNNENYNNTEKSKQTKIEKYNDSHYNNRELYKNTCLIKYGVPHYSQTEDSRNNNNRSNQYFYKELIFNSGVELAFYIFHQDNNDKIEREPCKFKYTYKNKVHYYFPDFKLNGKLYEIKGKQFLDEKTGKWKFPYYNKNKMTKKEYKYYCALMEAKHQCAIKNKVIIIYDDDCSKYINYVKKFYGKNFIKSCKKQRL